MPQPAHLSATHLHKRIIVQSSKGSTTQCSPDCSVASTFSQWLVPQKHSKKKRKKKRKEKRRKARASLDLLFATGMVEMQMQMEYQWQWQWPGARGTYMYTGTSI